jgi:cell wall-associated NlpC family hydrolase
VAGPGVSAPAVAAAGVGALVLWSALKGASVTGGLRSLLTGKQPSGSNANPITGDVIASSADITAGSAGATGSAIADDAMRYYNSGTTYKWGGGSPQGWDCSGFCNWVIGHDLGLAIPGHRNGQYSGHGPVTWQWAVFGKGISRDQVQAGDLVVWPAFHMGIAISNSQMINCPGPNGTPAPVVSPIDENIGGPRVFRRISTAGLATGTTQASGTTTAGGRG